MCYTGAHEDLRDSKGATVVVPIKPNTELPLVLQSIDLSGLYHEGKGWLLYDTLYEAFCKENDNLNVHDAIEDQFLADIAPFMHWVEEPINFHMSPQDLWRLHGAFDHFFWNHRPDCHVSEGVWHILSNAVGDLEGPPT